MWFYVWDRSKQNCVTSKEREKVTNIIDNKTDKSDRKQIKVRKMANLLDSVENSAWHAFDYLALEGDGTAQKSKLKVSFQYIFSSKGIYYKHSLYIYIYRFNSNQIPF